MGFWDFLPWVSDDKSKVDADMAATAYMGVTMNNIQNCATPESGFGGGSINVDIVTHGNLAIGSIDLSQTSTSIVDCFYQAQNQDTLNQSLSDTLTAMAENQAGLMSGLLSASTSNTILTDIVQNASQKVVTNNIQTCGIGSSDINVDITTYGNAYIGNITASNNPYSYLSCVFNSDNTANLSQELAATTTDTASTTKKGDPLEDIIAVVVFVAIFIALIIGGFIVFRMTEGMFSAPKAPLQSTVPAPLQPMAPASRALLQKPTS